MTIRWDVLAGSVLLLIAAMLAWQFLPPLLGLPDYILPRLSKVVDQFGRMLDRERLFFHAGYTLLGVMAGFGIGSVLGAVIGFALGVSRTAEAMLSPYILALQIAPKVAFAPLFVIWLGYTIYPKILVAALIVFFPVMVNVLVAVRTVDLDLVNLVRSMDGSRWQVFRKVEVPAVMPALFAGLRIASTLAVIGVTVGEFIGGDRGLGYLLVYGEGQGNTAMVFVAILMLTLIGILVYLLVILFERRALHYIPRADTFAV